MTEKTWLQKLAHEFWMEYARRYTGAPQTYEPAAGVAWAAVHELLRVRALGLELVLSLALEAKDSRQRAYLGAAAEEWLQLLDRTELDMLGPIVAAHPQLGDVLRCARLDEDANREVCEWLDALRQDPLPGS